MNTMTRCSTGSTAYWLPYAPPQLNVPTDAIRAVALHDPEPEPESVGAGRVEQHAALVVRHEIDCVRRENAHPVELAPVEQHLEQASVIRSRRDESRPSREALARTRHVVALAARAVRGPIHVVGGVARIDRREPSGRRSGDKEEGVV